MKQRTRVMQGGEDLTAYNMANSKKDDDDCSEIQLYRIKPQDHFIEAQVQEGDTLQAIALRFYCSIAELKRINHIHKDNEIFARRTIKVPVTPYSVLTELVPVRQAELPHSAVNAPANPHFQNLLQNQTQSGLPAESNTDKVKESNECAIDCNAVILNSTVAPSVVPYTDCEPAEQVSEDTMLLPNKEKISVETVVVKELTSHGADFGLKWFHLLCCVLILGVVIPLVYVMFYLDKHEHLEKHEHPDLPPLHIIT